MSSQASLSFSGDTLMIKGEVDFMNVVSLRDEGDNWLRGQAPSDCILDLSEVTRCNSAATTLLLSWLRTAKAVNKTLVIEKVPTPLRSLMDLGGVEELLAAEEAIEEK